jgi:hypothetical protein
MHGFWAALAIGVAAGFLDAAPMLLQKRAGRAAAAAFLHWLALGLIIPYLGWGFAPWLTGALAGVLATVPVVVMIGEQEPGAWRPVLGAAMLLGAGVGWAGAAWVHP